AIYSTILIAEDSGTVLSTPPSGACGDYRADCGGVPLVRGVLRHGVIQPAKAVEHRLYPASRTGTFAYLHSPISAIWRGIQASRATVARRWTVRRRRIPRSPPPPPRR